MPSGASKSKLRAISWLGGTASGTDNAVADDGSSRGKKPPRRGRTSNASSENSSFTTMASLAAVIMEASASNSPATSPPSALKADARASEAWPLAAATCRTKARKPGGNLESLIDGEELRDEIYQGLQIDPAISDFSKAFPRSIYREEASPRREFSKAEQEKSEEDQEKKPLHLGRRRWLLILTRVLIFVVFLTVGTKKIALGISISAVAALIAETLFKGFLPSARAWEEEEEKCDTTEGPSASTPDDNIVLAAESQDEYEPDNGREWSWNAATPLETLFPVEPEATPPAEEGRVGEDERPRAGKVARRSSGKTKNLLKKLVRKGSAASSVDKEE